MRSSSPRPVPAPSPLAPRAGVFGLHLPGRVARRLLVPGLVVLGLAAIGPLSLASGGPVAHAAPAPAPPVAPKLAVGSVLRPTFVLADGTRYDAGTAFCVDRPAGAVVVTAHHLFGPNGGRPAQLSPEEVVAQVREVLVVDAWSKAVIGSPANPLRVPGAHPMGADAVGDVAVFRPPQGFNQMSVGTHPPFAPLRLAAKDAVKGDPIWLAAELVEGAEATQQLHLAKVVEVTPGFVFYEFATAGLQLRATSGAPLLNAAGEVVGIHLGGGDRDGVTFGAAGPRSALLKNLEAAEQAPP